MSKHLISSKQKLTHVMERMQSSDYNSVTIPNMCTNEIVQLADKRLFRCFSVSLRRPHDLPPDRWELVKLPTQMPKLKKQKGIKMAKVDNNHILVDHVTLGLLNKNSLQGVFDDKGSIQAIRMYPPETVENSSSYWDDKAEQLLQAQAQAQKKSHYSFINTIINT